MQEQEDKANFGQIVAVIGAILIAVGFAWLIAWNWHSMPDALKIFILVIATLGAFISGVILKEKDYEKISQALFIAGSLLLTLTVFQISQIFSLGTTIQAKAWLWFFCFIGVVLSGMLFKSKYVLNIGATEFLIWIFVQYYGFLHKSNYSYESNLILSIFFLVTGIIISSYVFNILSKENKGGMLFLVGLIISLITYWFFLFSFSQHAFTLQESCFIILFSLIILIICAYLSQSEIGILICISNFFIWLIMQFVKILDSGGEMSPASFAFLLLIAGVFFYGLYLIHKSIEHKFSREFQITTIVYFIIFIYILSFQYVIPFVWEGSISGGAIIFLVCFSFLAVLTFLIGVFSAVEKRAVSAGEIIIFSLTALLIIGLLFLTSLTTNTLGNCYQKTCYDFNSKDLCNSAPKILNCEWINYCIQKNCRNYQTQESCLLSELGCNWQNKTYYNQCEAISYNQKTSPNNLCSQFDNQIENCRSNKECKWNRDTSILGRKNMPASFWIVWIIINLFFIGFILLIIGYGSLNKDKEIINIGIVSFALEIITRYIGFIIDFKGYNMLAVIFISGGVILIIGGWLIEKWRRSLIKGIGQNE
jgi:uncharacterized membrane protein